MNSQECIGTARALVADDKGLLAMDESNSTCNTRFARLGIPQTEETHVWAALHALYYRARCNRAARRGEYNAAMERT
jgi:fructose-bisphosphate aldolase class 1